MIKKWYCPHCDRFKRFSRIEVVGNGYPDNNLCFCCGTKMVNARDIVKDRDEHYVRGRYTKEKDDATD